MLKIEHIIFDFGGVLYTIDFNRLLEAFARLKIPDSLWSDRENNVFIQLEKGEINADSFLRILQLSSPLNPSLSKVKDAFCEILVGMPVEHFRYLRRLSRHYPCYLLSNTNEIHFDYFSKQILSDDMTREFYNTFRQEFYSHELGLRKPDPQIYHLVLAEAGLNPNNCLFVDDMKENVDAAATLGFQVFQFGMEGGWAEMIHQYQLKV